MNSLREPALGVVDARVAVAAVHPAVLGPAAMAVALRRLERTLAG
ncbi:hypothetical protein [Kitasatospora paranensis]|uniref:Uncharacterized protein n=1 Tax=Kitasatospora paranensis TaxID=258053 RepID=A0ABW2FTK1_9ACTN